MALVEAVLGEQRGGGEGLARRAEPVLHRPLQRVGHLERKGRPGSKEPPTEKKNQRQNDGR